MEQSGFHQNINLPTTRDITQMRRIRRFPRDVVALNLSGEQMAYHLSVEITVRVSTDTETDTV